MGYKYYLLTFFLISFVSFGIAQKKEAISTKKFTPQEEQLTETTLSFCFTSDSIRYITLKTEFENINRQIEKELFILRQQSIKDNFETTQEFQTRVKNAEIEIIKKNKLKLSLIEDELNLIKIKFYRYRLLFKAKLSLSAENYNADNQVWKGEINFDSSIEKLMLILPAKSAKTLWNEKDSLRVFLTRRIESIIPDTFLITHNDVKADAILLTYDKYLNIYIGKLIDTLTTNYDIVHQSKNSDKLTVVGLKSRKIINESSFVADFTENARISVDINVDNLGNVISAKIQPRGTTTGNIKIKNIAIGKASQLKFNRVEACAPIQTGTIIFNFYLEKQGFPRELYKPKPTPKDDNEAPPVEVEKPKEIPSAPKPKAIYKDGIAYQNETAGNNTNTYQPSKGQSIVGVAGAQGKLNDNPSSDSYSGNRGTDSGISVSISKGLPGRKINRFPSFEDDISENAKVAVDIKVDNNGNVTSATIQPRGTTTGNANTKNNALRKARQLKFSPDEDGVIEQIGTIIFSFRVRQ